MNVENVHGTPAIVLGSGPTGLGTLRSLVLAGIPTYVACPQGDLVTHSRWYRPVPGAGWDGSLGPTSMDRLAALPLERAVIVPARDEAALWLADLPASELKERFRVSTSPRASLEILQDKTRFGEYLHDTSMPHPRTFTIACAADIEAIPFDDLDRVFLKPSDSHQFIKTVGAKGLWATDRRDFLDKWRQLDQHGFKIIAQEYVPGSAADHYFLDGFRDRGGDFTGLFARRRRRIYPADFGNSSYCQSVPLSELGDTVSKLKALLSALHYRGIFSAEFKRDSRTGELRILEINTRAWWYVEFAARCGVNVCGMAHEDAQDLPVTSAPQPYRVGAGCVNLDGDILAVMTGGTPRPESLPRALQQWSKAQCHEFRWDDPWPAWSEMGSRIWQRLSATAAGRRRVRKPGVPPMTPGTHKQG